MFSFLTKKSIGVIFVVVSSFFYASYGIWTTLMGDFFGGYTASALRSMLVLGVLVLFALYLRKLEPMHLARNWRKLAGMTLAAVLIWGPLYYAVLEIGISISLSVNYSALVIGMLFFGWLLTGETFGKEKRWATIIGITGLFLIFIPTATGTMSILPMLAAGISGIAIAFTIVLAKQLPYNTTQSAIFLWLTSTLSNTPLIFILNEPIPVLEIRLEWLYLVLFALASLLASWLLLEGLKYIEAGTAGILGLLEIVFAVAFGVLLFQEKLELVAVAGIMMIMLAAAYPYLKSLKS